ncbi:MAG TPA: helix-turn-helix transcriptional regulator [Casimicrobiaceae bacterium]
MLTTRDYRNGWYLLSDMSDAARDAVSFARRGTELLPRLVASEITTLSVCDLARNTRRVVSAPAAAISAADRAIFDRHFRAHPLVQFHSAHLDGGAHRISDSVAAAQFRRGALYNEYYRKIGIDHVVAVPMFVDRRLLVSFVLNRTKRDFSDRECALLDLVRRPLAALYRGLLALEQTRDEGPFDTLPVTPREREVLTWVAAGKTDRQIAEILGMSPRTAQKHLQRIYEKLGVETRTAAVMRALGRKS